MNNPTAAVSCRSRKTQSIIALAAALWLATPAIVSADFYDNSQIDSIATQVKGFQGGRLQISDLEATVSPLLQNSPDDSELTTKLLKQDPGIDSKGMKAILAISRKLRDLQKKQKAASAQAASIASAQAAVTKAQQATAKVAAEAAAAHDRAAAAPADPDKAAEAATKDKELATALKQQEDAQAKVPKLETPAATTNPTWGVYIWSGARMQNPYSITNGTLKPNNNQTVGFIDLALVHRSVLSPGNEDEVYFWNPERQHGKRGAEKGSWDWFFPGQVFPDLVFRMGYVFNNNSTGPTNLTVSTIAGGSDIYSDNSIGLPFWRWGTSEFKQQATIELGGGFTTDKQFLAIHPNYFFGLGYQFHSQDWLWETRFGYGGADVPRISTGNTVVTDSRGLPQFDLKASPSWGTTITYDMTKSLKLQLGANAYFDKQATWNVSAGLSIDLPSIIKAAGGK